MIFDWSFVNGTKYKVLLVDVTLDGLEVHEKRACQAEFLEKVVTQILAANEDKVKQCSHVLFSYDSGEKAILNLASGKLIFPINPLVNFFIEGSLDFDAIFARQTFDPSVQSAGRVPRYPASHIVTLSGDNYSCRKIHLLPGYKIKQLCSYLFSLKFNRDVVEPNIDDLHYELLQAEVERKPRWAIRVIENRGRIMLVFAIFKNCFLNLVDVILKAKKVAK